jgi:hypothetical protein
MKLTHGNYVSYRGAVYEVSPHCVQGLNIYRLHLKADLGL